MASFLPTSTTTTTTTFFFFFFFFWLLAVAVRAAEDGFDIGPEKKTHLHFFFHDVLSGPNPTSVRVVDAPKGILSPTGFGVMNMIDDPLTEGPDPTSKLVGHAQGFYAMASQSEASLLMTMNFHLLEGDYNGSSLAILGRNSVFSETREMPVVGGTGYFRLARGYAVAKTNTLSFTTGDAIVEYNVYATHH